MSYAGFSEKTYWSKHILCFFSSFHKGTYKWLICYEKQERTFQVMTWRTLEQYSAGKWDIRWGGPKVGMEGDGFSEEALRMKNSM